MSKPNHLISQETVSEIFALAAELQAQQEQTYSIAELIEIGAEAHIAPEYIKQAFVQIQARNMSAAKRTKNNVDKFWSDGSRHRFVELAN
ncbi:MAG: hypothetical protein RLZZ499_321 [Cyanobacteriota bacterium]